MAKIPTPGIEKRRSERRLLNYPVWIESGPGKLVQAWMGDVSSSGALITLSEEADIGDNFVIRLSERGDRIRRCAVARREGLRMGVRFILTDKAPPRARSERSDWLE